MIIKGEIIQTKQQVQFKITPLKQENEINTKMIKQLIREVDIDDKFYDNPSILYQIALEYCNAIGFDKTFNLSNARLWVQSNIELELTYALKWTYDSEEIELEQINFVFDSDNNNVVKNLILLNIALEQKKQTSISPLIVYDKCEILYGISQYIEQRIEDHNICEFVPLLAGMTKHCEKSAINQLIIIQLIDQILSKFQKQENELFEKFVQNDQIIQQQSWNEDYQDFKQQELEMPFLFLRKTKQVYQYTKEDYQIILNRFKNKWENKFSQISIKNSISESSDQNKSNFILGDVFNDSNPNDDQFQEEEVQQKKIRKPRYSIKQKQFTQSVQQPQDMTKSDFGPQNNLDELTKSTSYTSSHVKDLLKQTTLPTPNLQERVPPPPGPPPPNAVPPPPPGPPPPKVAPPPPPPGPPFAKGLPPSSHTKASATLPNYAKYSIQIIEKNIDNTIWTVKPQKNDIKVNNDILQYFVKKERQQQIVKAQEKKEDQKDAVTFIETIFARDALKISIQQKKFERLNLKEIFEQINQLEFLKKNQDNESRKILEDLDALVQIITDKNAEDIEFNIKKAKIDSEKYAKEKIQKLKSLQNLEKLKALLELDKQLKDLEKEIEVLCGEEDVKTILGELELKLEQLRKELSMIYPDLPDKIEEVDNVNLEEKNAIFQKLEDVLLEKQQQLKSKMPPTKDKYQIHPNDSFLKYIYDNNPLKGINIEAFYKEHLECQIHIQNTVTQYREVFEALKHDEELIMYFQYIKAYGKVFNNIQNAQFGYIFENILKFSHKTQQLEGTQEELIKYIVESMINQKIPFTKLELTPFKHLQILKQSNKSLSEIQNIILQYKNHHKWLLEHLKKLSESEMNKDFVEKSRKYASEYKEYIFQMDTIYEQDSQSFKEIRQFLCDYRENVDTPQFFDEILTIKSLLREYYAKYQEQKKKQKMEQKKASRR